MRLLISLFLSLILFFISLPSQAEDAFLAIYCSKDFEVGYLKYLTVTPQVFMATDTFDDLDKFLIEVKGKAGNKKIILDLSVHGTTSGLLAINNGKDEQKEGNWKYGNLGLVVNKIRAYLHEENVVLILESCYAPMAFTKGLRGFMFYHSHQYYLQSYEGDCPFPIWGISVNEPNYCRLSIEDYLSGNPKVIVDLRKYDDPAETLPRESSIDEIKLFFLLDRYEHFI